MCCTCTLRSIRHVQIYQLGTGPDNPILQLSALLVPSCRCDDHNARGYMFLSNKGVLDIVNLCRNIFEDLV